MTYMFDYPIDPKYIDRTERRVPVITPHMRWMRIPKDIRDILLKRTNGKEEMNILSIYCHKPMMMMSVQLTSLIDFLKIILIGEIMSMKARREPVKILLINSFYCKRTNTTKKGKIPDRGPIKAYF